MHAYIDVYKTSHFFMCLSIVYLLVFPDNSDSYEYLRRIVVFYVHSLFFPLSALYSFAPLNNRDMFWKSIIRWFHHCVNIIEYSYTNLDDISYYCHCVRYTFI